MAGNHDKAYDYRDCDYFGDVRSEPMLVDLRISLFEINERDDKKHYRLGAVIQR